MTESSELRHSFDLFGSRVTLLIGQPLRDDLPSPEVMALQLQGFLRVLHARLTRFDPASELSALNACMEREFQGSSVLIAAVSAAVWAARRSDGLVDPTLVGEIEDAGYAASRKDLPPAPLAEAIRAAPTRRAARPNPRSRWREIDVEATRGIVRRPPGTRIDSGGTGKGLAADLVAERLPGYATFAVDAGGDLRVGGDSPAPRQVRIEHPLSGGTAHEFELGAGAVATSGIDRRIWRADGGFNHHLLDPSTGTPAWTGVVQATAVAATALEAETLAKTAFLLGPEEGSRVLAEGGGALVLDSGEVHAIEPAQLEVAA